MMRAVAWFGLALAAVGVLVEIVRPLPSLVLVAVFITVGLACGAWLLTHHDTDVLGDGRSLEDEIAALTDPDWM